MNLEKNGSYSRFKGWHQEEFGHYERHWGEYYRQELARCARLSGRPGKQALCLLEIGFGNGGFLNWCRVQGHSIFGLEIEGPQLAAARKAGFKTGRSLQQLVKRHRIDKIDGIVAFDVFEHMSVRQIVGLLRDAGDLLPPGGWILARFPNGESPFGRLNQHGDIYHQTTLGKEAMRQLCRATGMELAFIGSEKVSWRRISPMRSLANLSYMAVRGICELPLQLLLNSYYPGIFRWYPLRPNLVAVLVKAHEGAAKRSGGLARTKK